MLSNMLTQLALPLVILSSCTAFLHTPEETYM
jgi:hypothetical protein